MIDRCKKIGDKGLENLTKSLRGFVRLKNLRMNLSA